MLMIEPSSSSTLALAGKQLLELVLSEPELVMTVVVVIVLEFVMAVEFVLDMKFMVDVFTFIVVLKLADVTLVVIVLAFTAAVVTFGTIAVVETGALAVVVIVDVVLVMFALPMVDAVFKAVVVAGPVVAPAVVALVAVEKVVATVPEVVPAVVEPVVLVETIVALTGVALTVVAPAVLVEAAAASAVDVPTAVAGAEVVPAVNALVAKLALVPVVVVVPTPMAGVLVVSTVVDADEVTPAVVPPTVSAFEIVTDVVVGAGIVEVGVLTTAAFVPVVVAAGAVIPVVVVAVVVVLAVLGADVIGPPVVAAIVVDAIGTALEAPGADDVVEVAPAIVFFTSEVTMNGFVVNSLVIVRAPVSPAVVVLAGVDTTVVPPGSVPLAIAFVVNSAAVVIPAVARIVVGVTLVGDIIVCERVRPGVDGVIVAVLVDAAPAEAASVPVVAKVAALEDVAPAVVRGRLLVPLALGTVPELGDVLDEIIEVLTTVRVSAVVFVVVPADTVLSVAPPTTVLKVVDVLTAVVDALGDVGPALVIDDVGAAPLVDDPVGDPEDTLLVVELSPATVAVTVEDCGPEGPDTNGLVPSEVLDVDLAMVEIEAEPVVTADVTVVDDEGNDVGNAASRISSSAY
jgi:hypothetical protein